MPGPERTLVTVRTWREDETRDVIMDPRGRRVGSIALPGEVESSPALLAARRLEDFVVEAMRRHRGWIPTRAEVEIGSLGPKARVTLMRGDNVIIELLGDSSEAR
jgi:hypothetical protein